MLLDTLYQQLNTLSNVLFDEDFKKEVYLKMPNDIKSIIEKNFYDYKLRDILNLDKKLDNYNIDNILYDLQCYCDNLKDLLEMFFENEKWFKERKNYLLRDEGKDEYNLYLKYFK